MTKTRKTSTTSASKRPTRKTDRSTAKRRSMKATPAGTAAPAKAGSGSAAPIRRSKKASLLALLERPDGAAISDLIDATGWQVHSVRAALTGFRKDGKELIRAKDDGGMTRYRIAAEA